MNDISKAEIGDYLWTVQLDWAEVINNDGHIVKVVRGNDSRSYYLNGRYLELDTHPSAFFKPPAGFKAGPKPCKFKVNQKVLVRNSEDGKWHRRYFSHQDKDGAFHGFHGGADEWSAQDFCVGLTCGWKYCKAWEEGE